MEDLISLVTRHAADPAAEGQLRAAIARHVQDLKAGALALHGLSDLLPSRVHLTVPRTFRKPGAARLRSPPRQTTSAASGERGEDGAAEEVVFVIFVGQGEVNTATADDAIGSSAGVAEGEKVVKVEVPGLQVIAG